MYNATAHLEVFQVRNKVAGAIQVLKISRWSTEPYSLEQCNCPCGGVPNEKQNCWCTADVEDELSKHGRMRL